jgi:mannose-1-phosphate guanylyltransferase
MRVRAIPCRDQWWAVILAGGAGERLRALTERVEGDRRPKQFCRLPGDATLLEQTRARAACLIDPARTLFALTRAHERYYAPLVADVDARRLVVQALNRGTAPAVFYALTRIAAVAPAATVVLLPCDHYVSDDRAFMRHVGRAFQGIEDHPDRVVLLGIAATEPETDYGWIEPGAPVGPRLRAVVRFVEKPTPDVAARLLAGGCLWNSFVTVGRVATILALVARALPRLDEAFTYVRETVGGPLETAAAARAYVLMAPADFSRDVLAACPSELAVLPVRGVGWSDLGTPSRVLALARRRPVHGPSVTAATGSA